MKTRFRFLHSIIAVSSVLVMLFTSCNMFNTHKAETADEETVTLHIGDSIFRNALPRFDSTEYISFELTAERQGSTSSKTWTWEKTDRKTAEQVMKEAEITINTGTYNFTLIGKERYGATSRGEIKDKVISADMSNADKLLTFTIAVSDVSEHGVGKAYITVNYNQDLTVKSLSVDLFPTSDGIHYTVDNYRLEGRQSWDNLNNTSGSKEYIVDGIPAGKYIALFTFNFVDGQITRDWAWSEPVWISSERISFSTININSNKYFTITYNPRGGTLTGNEKQFYTPLEDVTLTTPPVKDGLVFAGWYMSDDDGESLSDTETRNWQKMTHSGNIQLYAKWNALVSFNANDSEDSPASGTMENIVVEEGSTIASITTNAFTRDGYAFNLWNTAADGSGTTYVENASLVAKKNTTLYVQWVEVPEDSVALTFRSNGGTFVDTLAVTSGTTLTAAQRPVPVLDNYDFAGWYTSEDEGLHLSSSAYTFENISESVTLYAKWTPKVFNITYLECGGEDLSVSLPSAAPITHTYDQDTTLPVLEKDGLVFLGWYKNINCTDSKVTTLTSFDYTADITLYALFSAVYYVSATDGNDSSGTGSEESPFATVANAISVIKASGSGEVDYTIMINGELTENVVFDNELVAENAKSLTIRGVTGNEIDIIKCTYDNRPITVETEIPIILRDVKITNGGRNYGAVNLSANTRLTLASGAKVSGNTNSVYYRSGSGVYITDGTLIMEDGAEISDNTITSSYSNGAGVYMSGGTFIMNGGKITGNNSRTSYYTNYGGGVYMYNASFTMNGGEISGNITAKDGGGVYMSSGDFVMTGGKITGNTSGNYSSAIYIGDGSFTMTGGIIYDNSYGTTYSVIRQNTGTIFIGGSACIKDNVNLGGSYIAVVSTLTANSPVAVLTGFNADTQIIKIVQGTELSLADEAAKFATVNGLRIDENGFVRSN